MFREEAGSMYWGETCCDGISGVFVAALGLCGCGSDRPKLLCADVLEMVANRSITDSDTVELMLHVLDDHGLCEHGSSVFGCWLTDSGKELLELVQRLRAELMGGGT